MAKTVDEAHAQTDEIIAEIEKRLNREYKQASKEVAEKYQNYMAKFEIKDQIKQQEVANGTLSQEEYTKWRYGQVCIGKRWNDLKQQLATDLKNTDMIARSVIQDHMPEVYALNHNYATFRVERDSLFDSSYTLYDRRTVENLVRDDNNLLPYPRKDSPTARKLIERADLIWNREKIHSSITQGILQGESIPKIGQRLEKVVGMDRAAAIRNARTMMTGVQNKARTDAYDDLRKKGLKLNEKWLATLDGRTRHSHRHLHGTYKDKDTGKYANDLEYPGDPNGEPEEVYNCRCTEIAEVDGFSIDTPKTSPKLGDMTFEQWLNEHGENPFPQKQEQPAWSIQQLAGMQWTEFIDSFTSVQQEMILDEIRRVGSEQVQWMPNARVWLKLTSGEIKDEKFENLMRKYFDPSSPKIDKIIDSLQISKVQAIPTPKAEKHRYVSEIVNRIAGGDQTKGSCASLALCYCGNMAGYDCLDFRDGESRNYFSRKANTRGMFREYGITVTESKSQYDLTGAVQLMKSMDAGREYLLSAGRHMAAVRKTPSGVYEYLELQSKNDDRNGWHAFEDYGLDLERGLKWRWGCTKTKEYFKPAIIPVDEITASDRFPAILDYINTEEKDQKKGSSGSIK